MQNCKSKLKIIKTFAFLIVIFTFSFLIFNLSSASAQSARYPIPELGNCRNQEECYLYCQIPQNTPDCWSYGKYIMNNAQSVLGETTTNITYPITELGNCSDANACFIYCNQPKNQSTCYAYAKNHGLINEEEVENEEEDLPPEKMQEIITSAKTELGCEGKEQCMTICSAPENYAKCEAFAKKHNLYKGPPPIDERGGIPPVEILEKAKTELGCTSERSCMEFCNKPENSEKCMDFAKNNKLMREDDYEKHKKQFNNSKEQKEKMLEEAKAELGCDSYETCAKFCGNPTNVEKCMTLGRRHGMGPPPSQNYPPPKPCTNEVECRAYCEKNPQECKGFSESKSSFREMNREMKYSPPLSGTPPSSMNRQTENYIQPEQMKKDGYQKYDDYQKYPDKPETKEAKSGEFLGPGGCKTEGECKAYCEKHALDCPGFPKEKITPQVQQFNTQSTSLGQPPPNPTYSQTNFRPPQPTGSNSGSGSVNSGGGLFKPHEYKPPEYKQESNKYESEYKYPSPPAFQ